ncbi:perlucin-like protein [Mercenaria mercenaria]|uniref:perlucin-like protein n=1 Tax=Mercenaria mercenaria TaxID=6596 RepID=UPI00234EF88E|nr:perlucin-like protein [Mercenaria mercenaria]
MDFLEDLYRQSHSTSEVDGVWVSTTDIKVENEWVLSDGSAASYLNWHTGQPDKEFDYDDCVQVWPNLGFQWNDVYCIYSYWFYCEYEL